MPTVLEHLERLVHADPGVAERDDLAEFVATAARVRGWLDSFDLRCTRRGRELAAAGRSEPAESLLGRCGNRSSKDSSAVGDRETVADAMTGFEDSLTQGDVSAGHLDAIANATRRLEPSLRAEFSLHEAELLDCARRESVDQFIRRCRELARSIVAASATNDADELDRQRRNSSIRRWVDQIDGMHHTHLALDPVRDATLQAALDHAIAQRRQVDGNAGTLWDQLQVDAFIAAITGGVIAEDANCTCDTDETHAVGDMDGVDDVDDPAASERTNARIDARVPEVTVLIDLATLLDGLHDHSICETVDGISVPVSTVRRLCCDAEIIPVVLDGHGQALDVGRSKRTANRDQRRALRAMHRTCGHPGCTVPFSQTRAHHIRWWTRDTGLTDIENLLPLCERHHHLVHEGGWSLTMTPDRVATWTRPDGTVHHTGTTIDRPPTRRPQQRHAVHAH